MFIIRGGIIYIIRVGIILRLLIFFAELAIGLWPPRDFTPEAAHIRTYIRTYSGTLFASVHSVMLCFVFFLFDSLKPINDLNPLLAFE